MTVPTIYRVKESLRGVDNTTFLPPLHYQIGDNKYIEIIDELGSKLVNAGLVLQKESEPEDRFYGGLERFSADNGIPLTLVRVFLNRDPRFKFIRPDGMNQQRRLDEEREVVTAQLEVENYDDIPSLVLAMGGVAKRYEEARKILFDFSNEHPFLNNQSYLDFIRQFSEKGIWLKKRRPTGL